MSEVAGALPAGRESGPAASHDERDHAASVFAGSAPTPTRGQLQAFRDSLGAFLVQPTGGATTAHVRHRQ